MKVAFAFTMRSCVTCMLGSFSAMNLDLLPKEAGSRCPGEPTEWGNQYVFIALDVPSRMILAYRTGKRDSATTRAFAAELRARTIGRPQISTDAFGPYKDAIWQAFRVRRRLRADPKGLP